LIGHLLAEKRETSPEGKGPQGKRRARSKEQGPKIERGEGCRKKEMLDVSLSKKGNLRGERGGGTDPASLEWTRESIIDPRIRKDLFAKKKGGEVGGKA